LPGGKSARSAEEIKELLFKCTENVMKIEKYNESLEEGKSQAKSNRKDIHEIIIENHKILKRSRELLTPYDGPDGPVYRRKMNNLAERMEEVSYHVLKIISFTANSKSLAFLQIINTIKTITNL